MLLIGEVSKISQVSLRMLRYYDQNDIFKPKVINEENGYRYYSAEQLDELYRIVELRDLGFSVAEIKELVKQDKKEIYLPAIARKQEELEKEIKEAQSKLRRLHSLKMDIETKNAAFSYSDITIVMKKIPDKDVISYRKTVANYFCEGQMWYELSQMLLPLGFADSNECFSLYHDTDYREEEVDIELCVVLDKVIEQIPEGLIHRQVIGCENAVSILVKGPYENISAAYRKFAYWLENHPEYRMSGPNRQVCHVSARDTTNSEEYVTELLVPLEIA